MALLQEQMQKDKALENLNDCLHDNFWTAYHSFGADNHTILTKGIELAIEMQKAIIRVGYSLIERHEIKVARYFRYVMLQNDYLADVLLFQYPLALQKLGMFIMEDYKQRRPSARAKPLVISIKNSKSGMTLVLAVMGFQKEEGARNDFGDRFLSAADKQGVKVKHESFETGMIEIKNEEYRGFMQALGEIELR